MLIEITLIKTITFRGNDSRFAACYANSDGIRPSKVSSKFNYQVSGFNYYANYGII